MLRLKDLREDRDLLGKEVAKVLNLSQQQYSKLEIGDNQLTPDKLIILALFYNTSIDYILGITNDIKPSILTDEMKRKQKELSVQKKSK